MSNEELNDSLKYQTFNGLTCVEFLNRQLPALFPLIERNDEIWSGMHDELNELEEQVERLEKEREAVDDITDMLAILVDNIDSETKAKDIKSALKEIHSKLLTR